MSSPTRTHTSPTRSYTPPTRTHTPPAASPFRAPSTPAPAVAPPPASRPTTTGRYGTGVPTTNNYSRPKKPMPSAADTRMERKADVTNTDSSTMRDMRRPQPAPAATATTGGQPRYRVQGSLPTDSRYRFDTQPATRPVYIPAVVVVGGMNHPLAWDPYYRTYGYHYGGAFHPYAGPAAVSVNDPHHPGGHRPSTTLIVFIVIVALLIIVGIAIAASRRSI